MWILCWILAQLCIHDIWPVHSDETREGRYLVACLFRSLNCWRSTLTLVIKVKLRDVFWNLRCHIFITSSSTRSLHYLHFLTQMCSVVTILLFKILFDFDSIFAKKITVSILMSIFSWLTFISFWSLHNTTIPEALSSFVNKNRSCDSGGK